MNLRCNSCDKISKDLYIQFTRTCFNTCPFCFKYKDNLNPYQFKDFPTSKRIQIMISKVFEENPENIFITGGERYIKTEIEKQREIKERRERRSVKTANLKTKK